jgi:hypothetical protein
MLANLKLNALLLAPCRCNHLMYSISFDIFINNIFQLLSFVLFKRAHFQGDIRNGYHSHQFRI